ncbi:MAG TPA: ABC transporter ATP-binding protein [Cyclobacteriaceae bacterium]
MIEFALQKKLHTTEGEILLDVSAKITRGSFVTLYGSSGVGKTSVLRMLAGLLQPDHGNIKVDDQDWFDTVSKTNTPPQHRSIGFVFQDYALFPNMNVRENISFALGKKDDNQFVNELLELSGLASLAERNTQKLSGGQQQRVALARAIARKPSVLLLDEPLSAVDQAMRLQLQDMLGILHKRFSLTTIIVSHDQDEIITLSDDLILLGQGKFLERTTPALFFQRNSPEEIQGRVVAINENGEPVILIENRLITLSANKGKLEVHDKVVINVNGLPFRTKPLGDIHE